MIKTELYFGLSIGMNNPGDYYIDPDEIRQDISDDQFNTFVNDIITPLFPDGLTIQDAVGQYQFARTLNIIRERTKVVVLLHGGDEISWYKIKSIKSAYCNRFEQESVLEVNSQVNITF